MTGPHLVNQQAIILSTMITAIFKAAYESYWRGHDSKGDNIGKALVQWYVSMALRILSKGGAPVAISQIARMTGLPRINVKRHLDALAKFGVVIADDGHYRTNLNYVDTRGDAFAQMIEAVYAAADALRALR
jgi:biotin operon repressor